MTEKLTECPKCGGDLNCYFKNSAGSLYDCLKCKIHWSFTKETGEIHFLNKTLSRSSTTHEPNRWTLYGVAMDIKEKVIFS